MDARTITYFCCCCSAG